MSRYDDKINKFYDTMPLSNKGENLFLILTLNRMFNTQVLSYFSLPFVHKRGPHGPNHF